MERLNNSDNTIIKCINNSWIIRFDIWNQWNKFILYLWAHLHNLIKQNNNFSILKKIENPLLNLPKMTIILT